MIAVIYRFRLKPGKEKEYQDNWHKLVNYFVNHRGAIGSCLHKTADGLWVAYSRWPDEKTRKAAWPDTTNIKNPANLPPEINNARLAMKKCVKKKYPEICMEIVKNLL